MCTIDEMGIRDNRIVDWKTDQKEMTGENFKNAKILKKYSGYDLMPWKWAES